MLLKIAATGRDWGDKLPEKETKLSLVGVQCVVAECDVWEGPVEAGARGQYYRMASISIVGKVRDDRFSAPAKEK